MKLRPYQTKICDSVFAEWKNGARSTLVVAPTGTGKTILFASIIERIQPKRAMVLAHRQELIWQAKDKIEKVTGFRADVEMGEYKSSRDGDLFHPSAQVIVSTVQTHSSGGDGGGRMTKFDPMDFGLLIVDESHHSTSVSYKRVIDYYLQNPELVVLGVTATPDRADEEALGKIFQTCPDSQVYEILDAINDGWLVPIDQQMITVESLDFSQIRTQAGDLNGADLEAVMLIEKNLHGVASSTISIIGDKRGIGFSSSVNHAKILSDIFNRHRHGMSNWVCGKTDKEERKKIISDFAAGKIQWLWNCGVFTEGFDDSGVEIISMARPTKSRSLYAQMIGRATRPHESIAHKLNDCPSSAIRRSMIGRSVKPSCILEGQLVLTDSGLVPIEKITLEMKIWDGVDFVTHCGIIFRGEQNIINYAGLKATEDHKVWTEKGWKTFRECAFKQTPISVTGISWKEVREVEGYFRNSFESFGKEEHALYFDRVRLWDSMFERIHKSNFIKSWMQNLWSAIAFSPLAFTEMCGSASKMHKSERYVVFKIRWPWNKILLSVSKRYVSLGSVKSWFVQRKNIRQNKQRWELRSRKYEMGNTTPATMQSESEKKTTICDGSSFQNRTPQNKVCRSNIKEFIFSWFKRSPSNKKIQYKVQKTKGRVWDILNCGPRHRFTVSGLLVSNCLIIDFVGNSGKHKLITTADILGGKVSDEVIEATVATARKLGQRMRMDKTIEEEEKRLEEKKKKDIEEQARKARLVAKSSFKSQSIDPFDILQIKPAKPRGWDEGKQLSEKMSSILRKAGFNPDEMDYAKAKQLVGILVDRWSNHKCTLKQAKLLKKFGYDTEMSMDDAKKTIDAIAQNGWRRVENLVLKKSVKIPSRREVDDVPMSWPATVDMNEPF